MSINLKTKKKNCKTKNFWDGYNFRNLEIFEIFAAQFFVVSKMEYFLSYLFSWRAYAELDINCVNNYYENFTIFIIMFNDFWKILTDDINWHHD